jgi:hypothetical protein
MKQTMALVEHVTEFMNENSEPAEAVQVRAGLESQMDSDKQARIQLLY